jgi:hypothetical protein
MPAESQSQRRWAFGVKGPAWAKEHHFDNPGKLPEKVKHQAGTTNVGLALFKAMQNQKKKPSRA